MSNPIDNPLDPMNAIGPVILVVTMLLYYKIQIWRATRNGQRGDS